ncbi:uncharacterized protein LOC127866026 [Dreissena polymorpha]|nr:uncharacterized protein LOC127866026 [Dreissena polymorpha]
MEWDYRTEYAHDVSDDSSWLIQHDVVKRGVCDSCHGNIQNLGHITEDLKATLHYSGMKSDSVRTACMSCGNVADVDNDSAARAHSECPSIELVLNCTIQSNNLPPKGRPQLVDCATQTEIQTSVGQMWPGLADMPRYLNPILTQLIKIGLQIPKALQW